MCLILKLLTFTNFDFNLILIISFIQVFSISNSNKRRRSSLLNISSISRLSIISRLGL